MHHFGKEYAPEDSRLPPLDQELIPREPPLSTFRVGDPDSEDAQWLLHQMSFVACLGHDLLRSAWRLVELSKSRQGHYAEGMELPVSSRAAATEAIVVGCAAFEAILNETIFDVASRTDVGLSPATARLLELSIKLSPKERLESFAAICGETINWGVDPFQSLAVILSIRKHLLHHESRLFPAHEGNWPAKQLRDLPRRIGSPYPDLPQNEWHTHLLSPAGAEWTVRVIFAVAGRIDLWEVESRADLSPNLEGGA